MSLFEVVYGFKLLTLLDLIPFSQDVVLSLDGSKMVEAMKKLHEKVQLYIEKKNQSGKEDEQVYRKGLCLNQMIGYGCNLREVSQSMES